MTGGNVEMACSLAEDGQKDRFERLSGGKREMSNVEAAIDRIASGGMVIVIDDADREAEGDLVIAGSHCTPDAMAFIIRHSCGIVCAPMSAAEARRLQLAPMVAQNDAPLATAFTVSVDITHNLTTGISAEQRSNTIRGLANSNMGAADFVRPGHVFPLIARDGGVLMRSGHTEAAVDLCRLAKQPPVGVICELANDDGTVMKGQQINKFAELYDLPVVSVDEMICWRREREVLIARSESFQCETVVGPMTGYAFSTPFDSIRHFAFVLGDINGDKPVPVRIHRSSVVTDVIVSDSIVHRSLQKMATEGCGVLVYLREGSCGVPLSSLDRDIPKSEEQRQRQWLEVGLGAQILNSLKVCRIKLITERQVNYVGLGGFGLKIEAVERAD